MASATMSTFVALPEVRHRQLAGTFEPSTELLDRLRGLLILSPASQTSTWKQTIYSQLPFEPEQQTPQIINNGSGSDLVYPSSLPRSEPKEIRVVKSNRSPKHSPRSSRPRRAPSQDLPRLIHPNILDPWDTLPDESCGYVTTFSTTFTLRDLISGSRRMTSEKVDVYFKQAILGLEYLHRSGIAHQDLRPENFIITTINNVLQIANFGNASYSGTSSNSRKILRRESNPSSIEYAAPEVLVSSSYSPKPADMWAMGVIYMEMRRGRLLWNVAAEGADECYDRYLQVRAELWGYRPIENLANEHCRRVIASLLDPVPERRYTSSRVLKSTWCSSIRFSVPE